MTRVNLQFKFKYTLYFAHQLSGTITYVMCFRFTDQNEVPFGFWFIGNFEEMQMTNSGSDKVLKTRLFKRSPDMTAEDSLLAQLRQILERKKNGDTGSHILPYPRLG